MSDCKIFLLRHAHRPKFEIGGWENEISITPEGYKKAKELGCNFSLFSMDQIVTSPVKRCHETAKALREGMGRNVPIHFSKLLGAPGFIIEDPSLTEKTFLQNSPLEIADQILKQQALSGFFSLDEGCKNFFSALLETKVSRSLWISHDIFISIFAGWLFRVDDAEKMMPNFLEGIELSIDREKVYASYKAFKTKIDVTSFSSISDSS